MESVLNILYLFTYTGQSPIIIMPSWDENSLRKKYQYTWATFWEVLLVKLSNQVALQAHGENKMSTKTIFMQMSCVCTFCINVHLPIMYLPDSFLFQYKKFLFTHDLHNLQGASGFIPKSLPSKVQPAWNSRGQYHKFTQLQGYINCQINLDLLGSSTASTSRE